MPKPFFRRGALCILGAALLCGAAAGAHAQQGGGVKLNPPVPHRSDPNPPVLWNYFAAIVIVGAVAVANAIPSKRGHQD